MALWRPKLQVRKKKDCLESSSKSSSDKCKICVFEVSTHPRLILQTAGVLHCTEWFSAGSKPDCCLVRFLKTKKSIDWATTSPRKMDELLSVAACCSVLPKQKQDWKLYGNSRLLSGIVHFRCCRSAMRWRAYACVCLLQTATLCNDMLSLPFVSLVENFHPRYRANELPFQKASCCVLRQLTTSLLFCCQVAKLPRCQVNDGAAISASTTFWHPAYEESDESAKYSLLRGNIPVQHLLAFTNLSEVNKSADPDKKNLTMFPLGPK